MGIFNLRGKIFRERKISSPGIEKALFSQDKYLKILFE